MQREIIPLSGVFSGLSISGAVDQVQQRWGESVAGHHSNVSQVMKCRRRRYWDSVGVCQRDHLISLDLAWLMHLLTAASGLLRKEERAKRCLRLLRKGPVGRRGNNTYTSVSFFFLANALQVNMLYVGCWHYNCIFSNERYCTSESDRGLGHAMHYQWVRLHCWCTVAGQAEILEAALAEGRAGWVDWADFQACFTMLFGLHIISSFSAPSEPERSSCLVPALPEW